MTDELDPVALDRKIQSAALTWRRWRRKLGSGDTQDDEPLLFHRDACGRRLFQELADVLERDPLARPMQRWVYRLAEQRINAGLLVQIENARRLDKHVIEQPENAHLPLSDLLALALRESLRRSQWLKAFSANAGQLAAYTGLLWERRQEIARRMALTSPDEIELPCVDLVDSARALLARTDDMAQHFARRDLGSFVDLALGVDASEGWPGRLTLRSLVELFRETRLFDELDLVPGEFPEAIASSSFLRALARLGAAWRDATAPKNQPFVIAHEAYGLERRQLGALFGSLPLGRAFLAKSLNVSKGRTRDQARVMARVLLLETRALALRVSLRRPALAGRSAFAEEFEQGVERVHGLALPGALAGSVFELHVDDGQRFAGALLAASRAFDLSAEHNEDWFRNPRAIDQLRSEAELSPHATCAQGDLKKGADALYQALYEALA